MTTVDSRRPLLTSANPKLTGTGTSLPLFVAKGWIAKGRLATGWIAKGRLATGWIAKGRLATGWIAKGRLATGWIAVACSANGWTAGILGQGDLNEPAGILRPAALGRRPGNPRLETPRSVSPGRAAQIDDGGPV